MGWCDRILWKSSSAPLKQISYNWSPDIKTSDHKPVYATFIMQVQPELNPMDKELGVAVLKFKGCHASSLKNADIVGESDPYIHFPSQPILEKHKNSEVIDDNLNPVWKDKDLPELELLANARQYLKNTMLFVQVKDKDIGFDDKIGYGYILLNNAIVAASSAVPKEWVSFTVKLELGGRP